MGWNQSKLRQAHLRVAAGQRGHKIHERQALGTLNSCYPASHRRPIRQLESLRVRGSSAESLKLTLCGIRPGRDRIGSGGRQTTLVVAANAYEEGLVRYRVSAGRVADLTGLLEMTSYCGITRSNAWLPRRCGGPAGFLIGAGKKAAGPPPTTALALS